MNKDRRKIIEDAITTLDNAKSMLENARRRRTRVLRQYA